MSPSLDISHFLTDRDSLYELYRDFLCDLSSHHQTAFATGVLILKTAALRTANPVGRSTAVYPSRGSAHHIHLKFLVLIFVVLRTKISSCCLRCFITRNPSSYLRCFDDENS